MKKISIVLIAVMVLVGGCDSTPTTKGPITIASKIDTEGSLLGSMLVVILEKNGFEVNDKTVFGPTSQVRNAIAAGEIDMYPEYTGNGAYFFSETDSPIWKNAEKAYKRVKELDAENGIVWLTPAPANNTWAVAIRKDLSISEQITSWPDFAEYVNQGGNVVLAGSEEFVTRPDALPSFQETYQFSLNQDQLLVLAGGNTIATEQAASNGINGVNAAMAYGTDGQLAALDLIVLEDTAEVQPVYQPAPIIRKEILDAYPEIQDLVRPVFQSLDLETLQALNSRIAVDGEDPMMVAAEYLQINGF